MALERGMGSVCVLFFMCVLLFGCESVSCSLCVSCCLGVVCVTLYMFVYVEGEDQSEANG